MLCQFIMLSFSFGGKFFMSQYLLLAGKGVHDHRHFDEFPSGRSIFPGEFCLYVLKKLLNKPKRLTQPFLFLGNLYY